MSDAPETKRDQNRATRELVAGICELNPHVGVRDIARALDISTQRVYKHLKYLGLQMRVAGGRWEQVAGSERGAVGLYEDRRGQKDVSDL